MKFFAASQIAKIDKETLKRDGITELQLIERVGETLYWRLDEGGDLNSSKGRVVILAGKGNNGNDAIALAIAAARRGVESSLYYCYPAGFKRGDVADTLLQKLRNYEECTLTMVESVESIPSFITRGSLVIDGLLGSGIKGKVRSPYFEIIERVNGWDCKIVALDLPSGLPTEDIPDSDSSIIKADLTLTLQFPKLSLFFKESYPYCGEWKIIPIGLNKEAIEHHPSPYFMVDQRMVANILRESVRDKFAHKGEFGSALLIAGSEEMGGAAIISAIGALRAGVGLLRVATPKELFARVQIAIPEAMSLNLEGDLFNREYSAVAIGPGIGESERSARKLDELLSNHRGALVIDADGINLLKGRCEKLKRDGATILTPHIGEFHRLLGDCNSSRKRIEVQISFSKEYQLYIALKGAFSSLSTPDGRLYFNSSGNAGMATAGSGDLLTGILLGLIAQGYPPEEATIVALFLHGRAGDIVALKRGEASLIATDMAEAIGEAFLSIFNPHQIKDSY